MIAGSVTGDKALVSWNELDIEGCVYSLNLSTGRNVSTIEEVETPHLLSDLVPGTLYSVRLVSRDVISRDLTSRHIYISRDLT